MSDADFTPLRVTRLAASALPSLPIREWAAANGHPVSPRGRIAREIIDAFFAANPEAHERAEKIELVRAHARTPGAAPEDYAWVTGGNLGETYAVVLVRPLDEDGVLRRIGASDVRMMTDDDFAEPGGPHLVTVRRAGGWTVAVEERALDVLGDVLGELSDGGEVVAVQRHEHSGQHHVIYAADGRIVTVVNAAFPTDRNGTAPDRLNEHLRGLGLDPDAPDHVDNATTAAFALVSRVSGVVLGPERLRRPALGGWVRFVRGW